MLQEKKKKNTFVAENAENMQGEMLEWLKRHAWKACIRQKLSLIHIYLYSLCIYL